MRYRTMLYFFALLFISVSFVFSQGLYWETSATMKMAGAPKIETQSYYMPHMFKQGTEQEATIFRLDKKLVYSIDYAKKEYSEMTFTELQAVAKEAEANLKGQMAELKKKLADMPAEQRKAMEQMMGATLEDANDDAPVEVTKASGTKTIGGYACTNYLLKQGKNEIGNIWLTTAVPNFSAMQKDFKEFGELMASQMSVSRTQMMDAMKKLDGFPMETTISGMTATVTKVEKKSAPASEFEVPAGFKKVDFQTMKGKRHKNPMDEPREGEE